MDQGQLHQHYREQIQHNRYSISRYNVSSSRASPGQSLCRLLVTDQSHDHSVQVEEEHQQVESQLGEALLLVLGQCSEDLSGVQQVVFLEELVDVVSQQWQVQQKHKPVAVEQEK